ncbi:unnamed protein product [Gemmataceae bacterium]|nr:unnamed protein product [Gemmataceae bacterium]VTU01423.1 unnamed protein product [Gemmataceae bacterium]
MNTLVDDTDDPRPSDPPFLFCTLLAAHSSGDRVLESLARDWLAEVGIRVVFDESYSPGQRGASR